MSTKHTPEPVAGLPNGLAPLPDVLTGGQPGERYLRTLADRGFRTVVDTRMPEEDRGFDEAASVREAGMEYVALPVDTEIDDETFARIREVLRDSGTRPMLIHCRSGNRVGALLAPYLVLDEGRSEQDALQLAMRVGLRSTELITEALSYIARNRADSY